MKLVIGYLYSDLMNIYGDTGNIICLKKRCQWRGIDAVVKHISIADNLKKGECDLYFFGGGQDQSQITVAKDLTTKAKILKEEAERGVPILSICGGYQLLGNYYAPFEGEKLEGVGIFNAYTKASNERMIGNIIVEVAGSAWGVDSSSTSLIGFENHSGKTYLEKDAKPLGKVIKGYGNNGEDKTEGSIYKNAIGCYMHGSLLPKNPKLADWLIQKALEVKYGKEIELKSLDDELEQQAHQSVLEKLNI